MPLSGLDIYKLLPKTNCRQCGFATCLAFAMQLAKKAVSIDKCPFLSEEAKKALEASTQPPIKLISIGSGDSRLDIGNETVMFRHEEKFHHPCGIGFIIEDNIGDAEIEERLERIKQLKFERVGQVLEVNLIAILQNGTAERFIDVVKLVKKQVDAGFSLGLVLMSSDLAALKGALESAKDIKPLIFPNSDDLEGIAQLAREHKAPLVVTSPDLEKLSDLTRQLNGKGIADLVLDTGKKSLVEKIWDLTQIRRQPLKKSNRALGYPVLAVAGNDDPYSEVMEAASYISKYAGIILLKGIESWEVLSLLTLRQNIYTDPQKPLQIEPKLYAVGQATSNSPVLVTTNFSLSYYTVLGEVEASKIPSYIMSVDTEGMSVLTAWAAEKFTPEKIAKSLDTFGVGNAVAHKRLIIPGYVAVMSGDLEEQSGWQIIVGPKEAAGIPSFLKNLNVEAGL